MPGLKVEYLVTMPPDDVFCASTESFKSLLRTIEGARVSDKQIDFGDLHLTFEIQTGKTTPDGHRYFHLRLNSTDESHLDEFDTLLRAVRVVLGKVSQHPVQTLWDGLGFTRAQRAYPLIYEIENVMRKLITKFMLVNVGVAWTEQAVPQELRELARGRNSRSAHSYLYEVDFIQLSTFLLREYSTTVLASVSEGIRAANTPADLPLEELKGLIPQSNWERYFSVLLKYDSRSLRSKWERLYDRRNQVAHNKGLSRTEYEEVSTLVSELLPILQRAVDELDRITVPVSEKEVVVENAAGGRNELVGQFLDQWSQLVEAISKQAQNTPSYEERRELSLNRHSVVAQANSLLRRGLIDARHASILRELSSFRNMLVHVPRKIASDSDIRDRIAVIGAMTERFQLSDDSSIHPAETSDEEGA